MHKTITTLGAIMALQLPLPATAQTRIAQEDCATTYAAGEWQLEVFYQANATLDGQPAMGFHYTHAPSAFSMTYRFLRDGSLEGGFDVAPLLDRPAIREYFADVPEEPGIAIDRPYRGELHVVVVDQQSGQSLRASGDLTYGWNPFDQRDDYFFSGSSSDGQREVALIRRMAESQSGEFELRLEFEPEGGSRDRLRTVTLSSGGLRSLVDQSQAMASEVARSCPAASRER